MNKMVKYGLETMHLFLVNLNQLVGDTGWVLIQEKQVETISQYRAILKEGERENLPPIPTTDPNEAGLTKKI